MNQILNELENNNRLVKNASDLLHIVRNNNRQNLVLFWFHALCPACAELIESWYLHGDKDGFLAAGNVLFVQIDRCSMRAFNVGVVPSMTVLKTASTAIEPNMFGTQHDVVVHCNTTFSDMQRRFGLTLLR